VPELIQKLSALCVYEIDKKGTALEIGELSEYEYEEELLILVTLLTVLKFYILIFISLKYVS
jgi:hypothetical protein